MGRLQVCFLIYINLEMPLENSGGDVEQTFGYLVLELKRDVWARDKGISL